MILLFKLCFLLLCFGNFDRRLNAVHGSFQMRITGGTLDDPQNYSRYVVSLRSRNPRKFYGDNHYCGGTIIAPHLILTAAHCLVKRTGVKKRPSEIKVFAGSIYRLKRTTGGQMMEVRKVVVHEVYSPENYAFDIGLLILKKNLRIGKNIGVMRMTERAIARNTICTIMGWGRVMTKGPLSPTLLHANVSIWPLSNCRVLFLELSYAHGVICASDETDAHLTMQACGGDSGGPLICNNRLTGVVSFGNEICGSSGTPTVYTDVHFYRQWIYQNCATHSTSDGALVFLTFLLLRCI